MDLSFSSMFFHDATLSDIFSVPAKVRADSLEFWFETPDFWLKDLDIGRLKSCIADNPVRAPLSVHAPVLDLNPCSINPDVREVSIRWIERSILLADAIGAEVCTIHPGRRTAKRPPTITDYQRLGYMLDTIEPLARDVPVKVAIENMEPAVNALLTTPEEVIKILDERPWLWFTFDAAHALVSGSAVSQEYLSEATDRIANIHLSGGGTSMMHQPVSYDTTASSFLKTIAHSGYDGLITLEMNDLVLPHQLTYLQKVEFLKEELAFIRVNLGEHFFSSRMDNYGESG